MTSFDALKDAWQSAPDPAPHVSTETLSTLRTEAEKFDRTIKWRDRREYAAAIFVAVLFGRGFEDASSTGRVGVVMAVLGAAFVCFWMWRAQRQRRPVSPDAPATEALRVALERVEIQIRLLRSVTWWYIVPLMAGPLILTASGFSEIEGGSLPPIETLREVLILAALAGAVLLILAVVFGFLWFIYQMNQKAVDRDLVPLRDRLARSLYALESDV